MTGPLQEPSRVRCNRGVGWSFWLVMGINALVTLIAVAGTYEDAPGGIGFGLGVGLSIAVLFILVRAVLLPRLEIRVAEGSLRTRRRTIPFSAVSSISVTNPTRAGVWGAFIGHDGKVLARMSIAGSLFAAATSEQWGALGRMMASMPGGANRDGGMNASARALSSASAIEIVQAQAAWCRMGHRSDASRAPAAALHGTTISFR
ncbi:hypothetical protein [Microbacterium sp.]|uniref:hypothetical protein n=1 Tax=Microbacterium sp. TaxID=51671 RepID=UPI003F9822BA